MQRIAKIGVERNVYWHEQNQNYTVQVKLNGKKQYLGSFETKNIAEEFRRNNMPFS